MLCGGVFRLTAALALAAVILVPAILGGACSGEIGASEPMDGGVSPKQPTRSVADPVISTEDDAALRARAQKLHRQSIVIDTHNDITTPMLDKAFDIGSRGDDPDAKVRTHTDIRRMKEGGLAAEFFAIYVDHNFIDKKASEGGGAARRAMDMIDTVYNQVRRHSDQMEMAYTAADIRQAARRGKIAALMGIEGGHAIEDSLHALGMFYRMGVRYMTLTHTNTNDWADSSGDIQDSAIKHHDGLTDFGREVVREMNRLGMMVDISHVSDKTFYDAVKESQAPVIASHSSCRALADQPRNMTDDMLRALSKNGGIVMINFYDAFLDQSKVEFSKREREVESDLAKQYPTDPVRVQDELEKWRASQHLARTPLSKLIDHIDHAVKIAGIDHVGIGSDFDGVPFTGLPEGMEDISKLPNITYELMKRGYSDADIKKILGESFLRVMSEVERVSSELQSGRH
jgi:membrane dipeptidase